MGQRLQTVVRSAPKSHAASPMVLSSGVHGRAACNTAVLSSVAPAPGTEGKAKDTGPSGMAMKPSTMACRWEAPTTNTICINRDIALEQRHQPWLLTTSTVFMNKKNKYLPVRMLGWSDELVGLPGQLGSSPSPHMMVVTSTVPCLDWGQSKGR